MVKFLTIALISLSLIACASPRQPRANCSGHLERINHSVPEGHPSAPHAGPESEGSAR